MAAVVFLRGINVGGRRSFRPAVLAFRLRHLDVVNIGAAGTFVVRKPVGQADLREEIERRLPFDAQIMICRGGEIARLMSGDLFAGRRVRPDIVRFVSILARRPRSAPELPMRLPSKGPWMVEVLERRGRFLVGLHRRRMKAIGCLGKLDEVFGAAATTRSWNTMARIARVLGN